VQSTIALATRYERSLSAFGMVAGYASDNYFFRRIDLPNTQIIFIAYVAVAAISIALLHAMVSRAVQDVEPPRWRSYIPMATQFALGGLWSAFLVFYSRSAVLTASWRFLLVLAGILIGNEVFKKYHSRLVFTAVLFFFAFLSYAIVTVPIYTRTIGTLTFVLSGIFAILVFLIFLRVLAGLGREQWLAARWQIAAGALAVYAVVNLFYFTGILPPLPLALARAGVYHVVVKTADVYTAVGEDEPWYTRFGIAPVMHVEPGGALYLYSAVFAPIALSTNIVHRWQRYDPVKKTWVTVSRVIFPIRGGRDGGYRGYTIKRNIAPGDWRVDIDTLDGHIIGRVRFEVEQVPAKPPPLAQTLG